MAPQTHQSGASPRHLSTLAAVIAVIVLAACGGGDDGFTAPTGDESGESSSDSGQLADNEIRDGINDAVGSDGETDLNAAISSLSPETRYSVVAGQLDPEPDVEINGNNIRLVFSGGTITDATMSCIIASIVREEDEILTVVYPDGERVC